MAYYVTLPFDPSTCTSVTGVNTYLRQESYVESVGYTTNYNSPYLDNSLRNKIEVFKIYFKQESSFYLTLLDIVYEERDYPDESYIYPMFLSRNKAHPSNLMGSIDNHIY
jgi:hypothetical protein